ELAQTHPILVAERGLRVERLARRECGPEAPVAHNDRIQRAVLIEGELILAQHAELAWSYHLPLGRLHRPCQQLHEGGLPGAIRAGEAVAASGNEADRNLVKEQLRAKAH